MPEPEASHQIATYFETFLFQEISKLQNTDQAAKCLTKELCLLVFITASRQPYGIVVVNETKQGGVFLKTAFVWQEQ